MIRAIVWTAIIKSSYCKHCLNKKVWQDVQLKPLSIWREINLYSWPIIEEVKQSINLGWKESMKKKLQYDTYHKCIFYCKFYYYDYYHCYCYYYDNKFLSWDVTFSPCTAFVCDSLACLRGSLVCSAVLSVYLPSYLCCTFFQEGTNTDMIRN